MKKVHKGRSCLINYSAGDRYGLLSVDIDMIALDIRRHFAHTGHLGTNRSGASSRAPAAAIMMRDLAGINIVGLAGQVCRLVSPG